LLAALYSRPLGDGSAAVLPARTLSIPAAVAVTAAALATLALGVAPNSVLHLVQHAAPETLPAYVAAPSATTVPMATTTAP